MISVDEALARILGMFEPLGVQTVPLQRASGRVLAQNAVAERDQPPFAASAMDGYAVRSADLAAGARLEVIGESAAGGSFDAKIGKKQAVRIFTGAPVPIGAERILIQEDCCRDGQFITVADGIDDNFHVRPAGSDFKAGEVVASPRVLSPADIAVLASMNCAKVQVRRRPRVALLATGNELAAVGETPGKNQIISSNNVGLKALIEANGGRAQILPIAPDDAAGLRAVLDMAMDADVIVTLGGVSVGDHDLVRKVALDAGLEQLFYKVSMRPGKPLMAGRLGQTPMIGLPGNPVSSMVCGSVFLIPALNAMLGLGKAPVPLEVARLGRDIGPNGPRSHYMRALLEIEDGVLTCTPHSRQDSSLLSELARANALMVRKIDDPAHMAGESIEFIRL